MFLIPYWLLRRSRKWCTVVRRHTVMENDLWKSWKIFKEKRGNSFKCLRAASEITLCSLYVTAEVLVCYICYVCEACVTAEVLVCYVCEACVTAEVLVCYVCEADVDSRKLCC